MGVGGFDFDGTVLRNGERCARPTVVGGGSVDVGFSEDVLERGDDDLGFGGGDAVEELVGGGLEDGGGFYLLRIAEDVSCVERE